MNIEELREDVDKKYKDFKEARAIFSDTDDTVVVLDKLLKQAKEDYRKHRTTFDEAFDALHNAKIALSEAEAKEKK